MSHRNTDPCSLINLQRQYILDQIKGIQAQGTLYALIIDDRTESLLNQVISKDSVLRVVTSIEKLDTKRRQQSFIEAIYFVELTLYTIKCMIADVETNRYKKGHGLFLPLVQGEMEVSHLYNSPKFMNNPKVLNYFNNGESVNFINSSFHPIESRVFLADDKTPNSMPIYYNENCAELVLPQIRIAAKSLVNLMVLTGEYPLIRFYSPQNPTHKASRLPELLADEFQRQIDNYARLNHDYPPPSIQDKPRSILLITDRTLDLFAPLLHEFSYQAMAMDIVHSLERDGVYCFKSENEKGEVKEVKATLENENDEDWVSLRHLHIIESSELIMNKINELIKKNPLMVDRTKATTSSDLMFIVAHLKGFDEERKQITLHKNLIDECLDINANRKLAEFAADFEQNCTAGGTSFEGVKNKQLANDLIDLLARDDLHVNDKMRLVLIYGLYRGGLIDADFVKLVKFIGVRDRQIISLISRCFTNLHKLGFPVIKSSVKDKPLKKELFHTINNEGTYNTSRFDPGLKAVLQKATKYQLDEEWFPYFRDKPLEDDMPASATSSNNSNQNGTTNSSLRNPRIKASWAQTSNKVSLNINSVNRPKQRIFCYVAGGVTYSEMRSIYELSNATNKDFYLGSESILKPRDFLIGLQSIDTVKLINDLNLNLYNEMTSSKEVPIELFETNQPKIPQPAASSDLTGINTGPQTPLHYQKRMSGSETSSPSAIPSENKQTKDKKRSKLKKLFR